MYVKAAVSPTAAPSILTGCISDDEMFLIFCSKCKDYDIQPTAKLFDRFLNHQAKKPFQKIFDMSNNAIGPTSSCVVSDILYKTPCLRIINMSGNSIGDKGAKYFSELISRSETIISLNLSSNQITDKGAESIFLALCSNKHLVSLSLGSDSGVSRNSLGNKSCKALKKLLEENKILSELDVGMTEITSDTIEIISKGISKNSTLEYLNVSNNNIQTKGFNSLVRSCSKSRVKTLHVANNQIRDDASAAFSSYIQKNRCIENIDFSGNFLSENFVSSVAKSLKSSSITSMNLNNNPLHGAGISALGAALNGQCRMRCLSVVNCQIDAKGFCHFCDQIYQNISLTSLHLGHNSILDEGAVRLSHVVKRHPCLKDIDLEMCEITEEGGKFLFNAFAVSPAISRINVKNNLIRDGVLIQKCLTENQKIFFLNADFNTMDYKITVEIHRLVAENRKRWKNGQKERVKEKVEQLGKVNSDLADTRQSILEEREFIAVLTEKISEMEEEEDRIRRSTEYTNDVLQKKLDELDKIVGGILLESQSKKDDVRSLINRRENEVSNIKNKLETTTQKYKQSIVALQQTENKISLLNNEITAKEDDLRIRLNNAKAKYKERKEMLIEAWRKLKEEEEIKRQNELKVASVKNDSKQEKSSKSKRKESPSKAERINDENEGQISSTNKKLPKSFKSVPFDDQENSNEEKSTKNRSPKSSGTDQIDDNENPNEIKNKSQSASKPKKKQKNSSPKTSQIDANKQLKKNNKTGDGKNKSEENGEEIENDGTESKSNADVDISEKSSVVSFSSSNTNESRRTKNSGSSLLMKKIADLKIEDGNEELRKNSQINSKKLTAQSPKIRSKSVQGAASKKPRIVIPIPNAQKAKNSQNQAQQRHQVTLQNQIIP